MDKKAIKTFAIESRKKLIEEIKYQASLLGITTEGIAEPVEKADGMEVYDIGASTPNTIYDDAIKQRESLVKRINEKGFDNVVEEVAYTWFNRIIAVRFMEINDYLPTRIRVLSSATEGKIEPDIVTEAPHFDLELSEEEIERIYQLKNDNKLDELFKLLFIKQCNNLNEILPELFEKTADYTELLLFISFTNEESVVRQLIDNISEEDFTDQVEIIGWLYQYYNTELKDDTFKQLKKRVKISKERIPAATQLFTPDWIVRYMVENSLGRLWLEGHPDSKLKENWKYYLEQEPELQIELAKIREDSKKLKPEDIKIIDPAMGSGHILVYAFDVLMQIYTSVGYSERDAAVSILENNLYGLDIDDRAYQLAYFAVMMKGRSYNKRILTKNIEPQICSIQESNEISYELINFVADGDPNIRKDLRYLVEIFFDAKEYGSIIDVEKINFSSIYSNISKIKNTKYSDFKSIKNQEKSINNIYPLLKQAIVLSDKYDAVITNPPYMGRKNLNKTLAKYMEQNFPICKSELYSIFILKCYDLAKNDSIVSMITIHSWMFINSFDKLREFLLDNTTIRCMLHTGAATFEELRSFNVLTTSFILQKRIMKEYNSVFTRLADYYNIIEKIENFHNEENRYILSQEFFKIIPGQPFIYWISENARNIFNISYRLGDLFEPKQGLATSDNKKFVRLWFEVQYNRIGFSKPNKDIAISSNCKWFPYNKGGNFRKWYGNNEFIVNWENDGYEIRNFYDRTGKLRSRPQNTQYYFKKGITWSLFGFENFGVRYKANGFIFDVSGSSMFPDEENIYYILAFLASKIAFMYLSILAPTVNFQVGNIADLPIIIDKTKLEDINKLSKSNINISKEDWDNFEESWNFSKHPLIKYNENLISRSFLNWENDSESNYNKLKDYEEKINEIFIEIYNLKDDLTPEVIDRDITIRKADLKRDMISFISYAVGCMLGRYSLDEEGLIYAGGQWDPSKYSKFIPDDDNIIPILDTEYFEDDIVGRFVEFVKVTFGEETLEENLDFIATALKKKGTTSREIIRNYFLTDFYKDHFKTYKKHPIYWQFDSGKNNGFKVLIYMHRYKPDLVARVRTDYLHKTQKALETAITHNDRIIESSTSASEKAKAVKTKNKLVKQLEETRKYDEALAHIADKKIPIDLDDGVKVNYAKFQGLEVSKEGKKATKIDLLKKI